MQKIRILLLVLFLSLCFACVGCNANKETETQKKQPVTINLATDDSVNGYRTSSRKSETMPDTIKGELVGTETDNKQYIIDNDFTVEKSESNTVNTTGTYCANKNSKIFHKSSCGSVSKMKDENKEFYSDRAELISKGYNPCKSCSP